jgi:hypothetical protein
LPEWGFQLGAVIDHTARARELGCSRDLIGVGEGSGGGLLYCVEQRGERGRAVGLIEVDTEANGETRWRDLADWLADRAECADSEQFPQDQDAPGQLYFWPDAQPVPPRPRLWQLVSGTSGRPPRS